MAKFEQEVKAILDQSRFGVLSTRFSAAPEYPFGSVVNFDLHPSGDIVIKIASIAEHFKNLAADPHASLIVLESSEPGQQQAAARATFLLDFSLVEAAEVAMVRASFLKKFPDLIPPEIEGSFFYWRGRVVKARWIGGFGSMGWVSGECYYE